MVTSLPANRRDKLNNDTAIFQVDDGTIVYYDSTRTPHKLYARVEGKQFDAVLPFPEMACIAAYGDSVYLKCKLEKIYKVTFIFPDGFNITFLRDISKFETLHSAGVCELLLDRRKYFYRVSDDINRDKILIECPKETLQYLHRIHRRKIVTFFYSVMRNYPTARMISENVIEIEVPEIPKVSFAPPDNYPFVYYANDSALFAMDTRSLKILPPLQIGGVDKIHSIAGLHNGSLTMRCGTRGKYALIVVGLPREYFNPAPKHAAPSKPPPAVVPAPSPSTNPSTFNNFYYIDPYGAERGPFRQDQMETWYNGGHFKSGDMQVRREQDRCYTRLRELERFNGRNPFQHTETREFPKSQAEEITREGMRMMRVTETAPPMQQVQPQMPIREDNADPLADQCACTICCEIYDSARYIPRVLDCGHTFCQVCVYNVNLHKKSEIKCPNCGKPTNLPGDRQLPVNYALLSMADQAMKSKADPKVSCKACDLKFSPSAVRMCTKQDCAMFNQLICLTCVVDDGHGAHGVVKYDSNVDKIRDDLRAEITHLRSEMEDRKKNVLKKTKEAIKLLVRLEVSLTDVKMPPQILEQLDSLASEQDVYEQRAIVNRIARNFTDECDTLSEAAFAFMNTVKGLDILPKKSNEDASERRISRPGTIPQRKK